MAPHHAALEECLRHVTDSAPMALERCLDHVVSVLQQAEVRSVRASERTDMGGAWRELVECKASWCRSYPDELRSTFKLNLEGKPRSGAARRADPIELALVDDDDVVAAIHASRLAQDVMPLVDRPVSELDALLSSALGLATIRPELNPVRPEVFAQCLRALVRRSAANAQTGSLWWKYMAEPLAQELQHLYGRLVVQLKAANVPAMEYTHRPASAGTADGTAVTPVPNAHAASLAPAYRNLSSHQISLALLRDFVHGGNAAQAEQPLPASYHEQAERDLAELNGDAGRTAAPPLPQAASATYRELPVVERPVRPVGIASTLSGDVWGRYAQSHERSLVLGRLRKNATRMAQVLGLELVRKVVNRVAQDPRLLAPMREAIVALEPSLLRLAMVDPRFLVDEQHPGRLLMEHTAQRSLRYNDEFSSEFAAFMGNVGLTFSELNHQEVEGGHPFEVARCRLEGLWARQDAVDEAQRRTGVEAVRFAELRQAEADQIAWELGERADLKGVPAVVQDFLFGPWALVMAHARLADACQTDPHGYRGVIAHLVWSVKPEVTLRRPVQLFERVPGILATLRNGLALLGCEPQEHEAFFQELMKLHHPVLRLRRAKSRRNARESGLMPLAPIRDAAPEPESPPFVKTERPAPGQPWMSLHELDAAGFQETLPTDMGTLLADDRDADDAPQAQELAASPAAQRPSCATTDAEIDPEQVVQQLREGDWVDLYSRRQWLRAQLVWASSKATLFMFVSHGGQPHSMTRRICERLIRDRFLRPVQPQGVLAKALGLFDAATEPG